MSETLDRLIEAANYALPTNPGGRRCPQDASQNKFKQVVYAEVRQLFIRGLQDHIKRIVFFGTSIPHLITFETNPFYWALYALKESGELDKIVTTNAINSLGWQLLHAHRHRIEPELLIGFLYQTAASGLEKQKLIKASGAIYYEPWAREFLLRVGPGLPERLKLPASALPVGESSAL